MAGPQLGSCFCVLVAMTIVWSPQSPSGKHLVPWYPVV